MRQVLLNIISFSNIYLLRMIMRCYGSVYWGGGVWLPSWQCIVSRQKPWVQALSLWMISRATGRMASTAWAHISACSVSSWHMPFCSMATAFRTADSLTMKSRLWLILPLQPTHRISPRKSLASHKSAQREPAVLAVEQLADNAVPKVREVLVAELRVLGRIADGAVDGVQHSPDGVFRVGGVGELLAEVVAIAAGHVRLVLGIHGHSQQGQGQYLLHHSH